MYFSTNPKCYEMYEPILENYTNWKAVQNENLKGLKVESANYSEYAFCVEVI